MRMRFTVLLFLIVFAGCSKSKPTNELVDKLSSHDEADRLKAVRLLQNRKQDSEKVVPALTKSLKDDHADIRLSAAIALGYFGDKAASALSALEEAQRDRDARVRNAASVAISRIRG
jgi:HEAT repeat protein